MRKQKTLHKGKLLHLIKEAVRLPSGKVVQWETVRHPGSCVILPVLTQKKVLLIRQTRHSVRKRLWEIPAGTLEKGELPRRCAIRELMEETGYRPKTLKKIATFYPSPGFCTEIMHLYLAKDLIRLSQDLEEDEAIETGIFTLAQAMRMIRTGAIQDAKTLIGLLLLRNYL